MSNEQLVTTLAGVLLSLVLSYAPGLRVRWAGMSSDHQRLYVLALIFGVVLVQYGLACAGAPWSEWAGTMVCTNVGAMEALKTFVLAGIANQATYSVSPQTADVKLVRAQRLVSKGGVADLGRLG